METIWEEDTRRASIKDKINSLESQLKQMQMQEASKKTKEFKPPFKWKNAANKSFSKANENKILCLYLTKKGQILGPMFVEVLGGNILIVKNKAHEFRPKEMLFMKIGFKTVPVYLIREIDRKPVSNRDWDRVAARGDSTKNDEVLLKMIKLAQIQKVAGQMGKGVLWVILGILGAVVVGYVIFG